jgi:hypothetical protein
MYLTLLNMKANDLCRIGKKIIWKIYVLYFEHIHCQCITQGVEVYCVLLLTVASDKLLPLYM